MILKKEDYYLYFAWVVALTGISISIYFGEFLNIAPCTLCWYQRMALFPLALILTVAFYTKSHEVNRFAIPLTLFGFCVALFHSLSLRSAYLSSFLECAEECEKPIFVLFNAVTFPDLSCLGFFLIFILLKRMKFYTEAT